MEARNGPACAHCGWREDTPPASPLYLGPRTILDGRYLLGRVLGAGGFGITYLGWDLNLDLKLAIKEYFPSAFGARDIDHSTVVPCTTQRKEIFDHGLARFLEEGRALAKFQGHPCIASVMTFFRQNGTSYLVMKYEDGITFQQYLRERGGRIDYRHAINLAMPVMDALRAVHQVGILHRDISPDNIFINHSGQVKILDFGSAKHDMASQDKSTQITLKRGYSPEEQYRSNGKVGTWTDVYALGATIYHAVSGQVPPESLDRLEDDTLQPPSRLGIQLPKHIEEAIMRSLVVRAPHRFQTIKEFQEAIATEPPVAIPLKTAGTERRSPEEKSHWQRWAILAVGVLCLALLLIAMVPPQVIQFSVEPPAITAGQPATMRWSVDRGSISVLPDIGPLDQNVGERRVTPQSTTTYTLTARRFLRSVTRSAVVRVTTFPVKFAATPASIASGAQTELSWLVGGDPSSVTIEPGIGRVQSRGHRSVTPKTTTNYILRAEKPGASAVESTITVTVKEAPVQKPTVVTPGVPPLITHFTADPSEIRQGQHTTLTWSISGEAQAVSIWGIGRVDPEGTQEVFPKATATYTLTASGPAGSDRRSVVVTVNQSPATSEEAGLLHMDVLDEKGQPMAALIEVEGAAARASYHTLNPTHTGVHDGKLLPGAYNVRVTASGYKTFAKSITVTSGAKTDVTASMVQVPK